MIFILGFIIGGIVGMVFTGLIIGGEDDRKR